MDDLREKAIKGLERCTGEIDCDRETHHNYCPYWNNGCFEHLIRDALSLLKEQEVPDTNVGKWISVKDGMPPEKETIFAKFKGTDQWSPAMFATSSEDVRVVVQFEDGTRKVWHDNTMDGKWKCEREKCAYPKRIVTHWMPNPELPKEVKQND